MRITWSRYAGSWRNAELQSGPGLLGHVIDHRFQVAVGFFEDLELAVGAGAGLENLAYAFNGFAASEFVDHRIDQGKILLDQVALWNLLLLAEVDKLAVEPIAHGAEFILHQQRASVLAK